MGFSPYSSLAWLGRLGRLSVCCPRGSPPGRLVVLREALAADADLRGERGRRPVPLGPAGWDYG